MSARRTYHLVWHERRKAWVLRFGRKIFFGWPLKKTALREARRMMRAWSKRDGLLCQMVVHDWKGRILFENTYGSDPRRTKG